jgi:phosphoglycerol geranylgeranyltransferase
MAYLILGEGGAAGFIGDANVIPLDQPNIAKGYALAGSLLGMRFIYLEAGSGAKEPVPARVISDVRQALPEALLVVGGGITEPQEAYDASRAGADIVVTGTVMEETGVRVERLSEIVEGVRRGAKERTLS